MEAKGIKTDKALFVHLRLYLLYSISLKQVEGNSEPPCCYKSRRIHV